MQEYKDKIEAILFTTGNFMTIEEISKSCGIASQGTVKELIQKLKKEYGSRPTSLSIIEENNKFKLTIKKEFNYLTTNLLNESELDAPTQKTLAIIAYKNPVLQNEIIKIRGNTAYDHIRTLKEQNFIISEKEGRTRRLKLAPKFYDYFDIIEQQLKSKFNEMNEDIEVKEAIQDINEAEQDNQETQLDSGVQEPNLETSDQETKQDESSKEN